MEMEYALLKHRGLQPDPRMESMRLLYFYSKYRKDREDTKNNAANGGVGGRRVIRMG